MLIYVLRWWPSWISIDIKNNNFVEDLPMIIPGQFGFNKNVSKCFFSETTWTVETKLPRNDHWKVLYKFSVFYADRKFKMAATAGYRLTLDPMGKCSNAFFSETTNMNHPMNIHVQFGFNHICSFREESI
jgi:hypothetical protein